ncbi:MAG: hypothetical protein HY860_00845 [Chlamydiales bacterium]|nr:hypothetical protein [Chlamydiales bacterium]
MAKKTSKTNNEPFPVNQVPFAYIELTGQLNVIEEMFYSGSFAAGPNTLHANYFSFQDAASSFSRIFEENKTEFTPSEAASLTQAIKIFQIVAHDIAALCQRQYDHANGGSLQSIELITAFAQAKQVLSRYMYC